MSEYKIKDRIEAEPDVPLSLLVIDMGLGCFIKCESGDFRTISAEGLLVTGSTRIDNTAITSYPFAELRAAIDAEFAEDERPVPRIERVVDMRFNAYTLHYKSEDGLLPTQIGYMGIGQYHSLCELAGKTLPIYEPKPHGEWTQLGVMPSLIPLNNVHPEQDIKSFGDVLGIVQPLPFKVYRYTRTK